MVQGLTNLKFTVKHLLSALVYSFYSGPCQTLLIMLCHTLLRTRYQSIFASAYLNLKYKKHIAPRMFNMSSWIRQLVPHILFDLKFYNN